MTPILIAHYDSSGGHVAIVERYVVDQSFQLAGDWPQALGAVRAGSSGVVVLEPGYGPYVPYVGTSPSVIDLRCMARVSPAASAAPPRTEVASDALRAALALSVADQAREVQAALSLNKTQLADVLGVSRPTLYDWFDGKEPNASNAVRLTAVLRMLASAGVTSANPLSPRFLRQALSERGTPLLAALSAESIDEQLVSSLVREAKALGEQADARRVAREDRLRALGFEDSSDEQRREQLARNVAMREWPKL
jgi:DNA-binding XRE family transcriptional regulator